MYKNFKLFCITWILSFMLFLLSVTPTMLVKADSSDNPQLLVSSASGSVGDVVDISVRITNNPGIALFSLKLEFEKDALSPISITEGQALSSGDLSSNLQQNGGISDLDFVTILWVNPSNMTNDGVLFSVGFKIIGDKNSELRLLYDDGEIANQQFENINPEISNGYVAIEKTTVTAPKSTGAMGGISILKPVENLQSTNDMLPDSADDMAADNRDFANGDEENSGVNFLDMANHEWAISSVDFLCEMGIVKGVTDAFFEPDSRIKRADFIVMIMRMLAPELETSDNFSDVSPETYYFQEVGVAKALGLVVGTGDNLFYPEQSITRQDMFVITYRAIQDNPNININNLDRFADSDQISNYAKTALASLTNLGLVQGSNGFLYPLNFATRAETAVFISRVMHLSL